MLIANIIAAACVLIGATLMLITMVGLWRAPDALTQANIMNPATGVGLPLLIIGKFIVDSAHHGFSPMDFIRVVVSIAGYLVVLAIGAFIMGRSLYYANSDEGAAADVTASQHTNAASDAETASS